MQLDLSTKETPVIQKTKELCQTLIDQPQFAGLLGAIGSFMEDTEAQALYEDVTDKQEFLVAKQQRGEELTDEEIGRFEESRDALLDNETARLFVETRQQIMKVQDSISRYVKLTFELGRVPLPEEAEQQTGGCCGGGGGGGCGCG